MADKKDNDVVESNVVGRDQKGSPDVAGPPTVVETIFDKVREAGAGASTFAERAKARVAAEKRSPNVSKAEKK